jgi:hypothetical protein
MHGSLSLVCACGTAAGLSNLKIFQFTSEDLGSSGLAATASLFGLGPFAKRPAVYFGSYAQD